MFSKSWIWPKFNKKNSLRLKISRNNWVIRISCQIPTYIIYVLSWGNRNFVTWCVWQNALLSPNRLVVAHITCQALEVWVNNMSVDDYHLRHLQGSCCNWLSLLCLPCPFKLQEFPLPQQSYTQKVHTHTHTHTHAQREREREREIHTDRKLDFCYRRDHELCVRGYPYIESYTQRRQTWQTRWPGLSCR